MLPNQMTDRAMSARVHEFGSPRPQRGRDRPSGRQTLLHPHVLSAVVTLDGRHKDLLFRHYMRLDTTARRQRFGATLAERSIRRHADQAGAGDRLLVGCLADNELRGVAEFVREGTSWQSDIHAALSVDEAYRSNGLGSLLFRRGLAAAREQGAGRVIATCSGGNESMHRLLKRLGARTRFDGGDLVAVIAIAR